MRALAMVGPASQSQEETFRLVVESARDAIVMTDAAGGIEFVNPAVERVFGFEPAELLHRPLHILLRDYKSGAREATGVTRSGEAIPLEISAGEMQTPDGRRTTWILRDVSVKKREAEQAETLTRVLQTVAREWVATFDAVDSPMLVLDRSLTLRRLNAAARHLFGLRYGDLVGHPFERLATHEPWITGLAICRRALAAGIAETAQFRDDVTRRTWDISVTAGATQVFPRQEPFLILILRDVTRVVELQEAHRRSEMLGVLGSVVAGVAHEVRNPLFALSATLEALESAMDGRDEYAEYLAIFRGEIDRISGLMHDLLAFGKPSTREHREGPLVDVLYAARQQCMPAMLERDVRVEVHTQGRLWMLMDEQRLTQLFQNLIENAIQHSPPGSIIDVTAFGEGVPHIQCQVRDRGPGIAPEDLPHVFEPFFSRRAGGTGLGLALAQRIVEEHRGSMVLSNAPGGGALADIIFPNAHP